MLTTVLGQSNTVDLLLMTPVHLAAVSKLTHPTPAHTVCTTSYQVTTFHLGKRGNRKYEHTEEEEEVLLKYTGSVMC